MNVTDPIREMAARQPKALAYTGVPNRMEVTYAAFDRTIDTFAMHALRAGLREGQTAIVELPNDWTHIVGTLALMRIGVAAAPPTLPARFVDARLVAAPTTGTAVREIIVDQAWFATDNPDPRPMSSPGGEIACAIFGTSGTTGEPRHFAVTHAMLMQRVRLASELTPLPPAPRVMIKVGLRTSFASLTMLRAFHAGALAAFPRNDEMAAAIMARQINALFMAPATASMFLQALPANQGRFPSLARVYFAGGVAPRTLIEKARERLCPDVRTLYGATEVGPVAAAPVDAIASTPNAVGIIAPEIEVQCVDDDDNPCALGIEGIVRIRRSPGSGVYLDAPEASRAAFRGDWFYPGDLGRVTEERVLAITGRTSEVVNVGGEKRSLLAIEEAIRAMGDIVDLAAFTVPDALGVHELRVAFVADPKLDLPALEARCREANVIPRRARFFAVAQIPRNDFGKVMRDALPALDPG